ncbi:phospholipase D family protein [Planosporangium mesophilum]|uniref:PLD phosphodiesterase domain-containing protein n=1 Tax=Planosporangium mesophilum TaxID=689768 RepID=A0A8J3X2Q6_9ACTN|nr:phospholipase D family protein [Planosporangium mesophilum]NJC86208.1 hypothetical protein [Planosporangium mesophilum]GII25700.1 hypothetical protein Pme01_52970 [Planosporangium mesophilum]
MLAPDSRAVLLEQLRPPLGYRLDRAVATTFTLDLTAALIPPLAFAAFEVRSTPDPVAVMEAVRSCTDRVDVFCQAGQITVPQRASDLMAFLEPMVHEVRRPRPGYLFHPKLWLLRYVSDTDTAYRLLCLSRNLTNDHSWDAVLRLDGERTNRPAALNRPLADLVRALPTMARSPLPAERRQRLADFAEDIRRIEWERPNDVREIAFHVLGLAGNRSNPDFSGYRHLVVAPFCNDQGLDRVAPSNDVTVVSRVEDLDRLAPSTASRIDAHVVSALAGLEESTDPADGSELSVLSGLHAKLYVVERSRRAHVFLGSANATDAAFGGNVEVLVELVGGATKLGVETFLGEDAPFAQLLEEYAVAGGEPPDPQDEALWALENLVRDLAEIGYAATVEPADGGHRLSVTSDRPLAFPDGYQVSLELLTRPGQACRQEPMNHSQAVFEPITTADITPFVALHVESPQGLRRGTVIRAVLVGDPAGRLDEVLARQVDSTEKFLRFLALLLGLSQAAVPLELAGVEGAGGDGRFSTGSGIFEMVVRALADQPQALADLDRLVARLRSSEAGRDVLPEGFEQLWDVIVAAHRRLPKTKVDR